METIETSYRSYQGKKYAFLFLILMLLLVFAFIGVALGSADIGLKDILNVIAGRADEMQHQIIVNIRLPRILSAILAGTALAVSGAAMQTILRNPL